MLFCVIFSMGIYDLRARPINTIIVHHSATRTGDVASFRRYHMDVKQWSDIGYHFVITNDAEVQIGRPIALSGAHARGRNTGSIGICLVGAGKHTQKQLAALWELIKQLELKYPDLQGTAIQFHHAQCPSPAIKKQIKERYYRRYG